MKGNEGEGKRKVVWWSLVSQGECLGRAILAGILGREDQGRTSQGDSAGPYSPRKIAAGKVLPANPFHDYIWKFEKKLIVQS